MTIAVTAVGTAHQSVSKMKEKWTNLQRMVKNEFSKFHKEQRKTGAGSPPKMPSQSTDKIGVVKGYAVLQQSARI